MEGGSRWDVGVLLFLVDVPALREEFTKTRLAVREGRPGDGPGDLDAVLLGHLVQDVDRGAVAQKDALGVDGYGVIHFAPFDLGTEEVVKR